jgi:hypothetical protein
MITTTRSLLATVLDAHGGAERWRRFDGVTASVVSGGFLWAMKGVELDSTPRQMTSDFTRQRTRTESFGAPDWHMTYQPGRVVIEPATGGLVAEQLAPRATFAGHAWDTPWTPLQLGYFNGYAMWTYYNLPFMLGEPGVETTEIPPVTLDGRPLRGLRATFPAEFHTHCPVQQLYFDDEGLLRRHDYDVDVAGGTPAAHFVSHYVDVQGLRLPTRRRVFMRNEDGMLAMDRVLVSVDLSDFELTPRGA